MTPTEKQPAEMSDTPRTNANRYDVDTYAGEYLTKINPQGEWVKAEFASTLELELAEKDIKIAALQSQLNLALDALERGRK